MSRQRKNHLPRERLSVEHLYRKSLPAGILAVVFLWASCSLTGCVNQHPEGENAGSAVTGDSVETMLKITDPQEKAAVKAAKAMVQSMDTQPRIIATSPAVADICGRLELDLAGVCSSSVSTIP